MTVYLCQLYQLLTLKKNRFVNVLKDTQPIHVLLHARHYKAKLLHLVTGIGKFAVVTPEGNQVVLPLTSTLTHRKTVNLRDNTSYSLT